MLTIARLRENTEQVKERLLHRNFKQTELVDEILEMDERRKSTQRQLDDNRAAARLISDEIGRLMKSGQKEAGNAKRAESIELGKAEAVLKTALAEIEAALKDRLIQLPNLPHTLVPKGRTPEENEVVYTNGEAKPAAEGSLPHWEIAAKYGLIDFELGVKITGAGFPLYIGKGARLQRALINYFLDKAGEKGYQEIEAPILVNEATCYGTGQLPDKEGQMYHATEDNLYLIPTAEVPLTNIYRDVLLEEKQLPIKLTGYTPCFRREAGSYGKDVRGLNRLHQFDKVEIVRIEHPANSYAALEEMREQVAGLLKELGLTFRTLRLCGGDMGFTSAMTYDMEVWSSGQGRWLEVSSVSNFESFQANRLQLRMRDAGGHKQLAHTLNGSALALPRIVAALLENNYSEAGVAIPEVLRPYTGFDMIN